MLHSIHQRYGEKLRASDGEIGHVRDFYFDDDNWNIRYLMADTGGWLSGRLVLISPCALGHLYPAGKILLVNLTRQQIEDSPSIDEHKPVSRQQEEDYHRHYGYEYYAESMPPWGLEGKPILVPRPLKAAKPQGIDSHLRSTRAVAGYHVEANDGVVGEVIDFLIDARTWVIRALVVQCGHWYDGKKVVIYTEKVSGLDHDQAQVYVDSTKHAFAEASEHAHASPT
jgi:uncharacterized protein YrrD